MLFDFLKHNPDCLIICPSFYRSFFEEAREEDPSIFFICLTLEEVETLVKAPDASSKVEGRSIYILHYDCGQKISELLGEFRNMSISYFPKNLVKEIDERLAKN